jgi:hypothetical protein
MTSTYESKTGMDPIASRGPMSFEEMLRNGPPGSGGGGGFGGFGGGNSSGQDAFEPDLAPLPRARTRGRLSRGGTPGSAYRTLSDDQMGELGELDPDAEAWEMGERSGSASASASASASGSAGASKGDPSSPEGSLSGVAKDAALASEHLEAEAAHEFHRPPSRPESDLAPSIRTSDTGHTPGVVVPPWTDVEFASTTHLNSV